MSKLYIIGNGFDLHHGLKSSYADFGVYLEHNAYDIYECVNEYLNISDNWSDFEQALENLDVDLIFDEASEWLVSYAADDWSDAYHHDYQFYIDEKVKLLSSKLYLNFESWIDTVEKERDLIDNDKLLKIDKNAKFLSFNYTQTLEENYGITSVNHIHGISGCSLVLGHAWLRYEKISYDEDTDTRVAEGIDIVNSYFSKTFKNSSNIIKQNVSYFSSLKNVDEVIILGHSLGLVDQPYFSEVQENVMKTAIWKCSYWGDEDLQDKKNFFKRLNIVPVFGSIEEIVKS